MAGKGVTEDDVADAADAVMADGQRPTIEAVRRRLGRGSPNTVNRHLDVWWSRLAGRLRGTDDRNGLPPALEALVRRLWSELQLGAKEATAGVLASNEQRLANEEARLKALAEQVAKEKEVVDRLLPSLQNELGATRSELRAAEDARRATEKNLSKALEAKAASDSALVRAQSDLAKATERAAGNEKHWMEKMAALKTAADHAVRELRGANSSHKKELAGIRSELAIAERSAANLAAENAVLNERIAAVTAREAAQRDELERQRQLFVRSGTSATRSARKKSKERDSKSARVGKAA